MTEESNRKSSGTVDTYDCLRSPDVIALARDGYVVWCHIKKSYLEGRTNDPAFRRFMQIVIAVPSKPRRKRKP